MCNKLDVLFQFFGLYFLTSTKYFLEIYLEILWVNEVCLLKKIVLRAKFVDSNMSERNILERLESYSFELTLSSPDLGCVFCSSS